MKILLVITKAEIGGAQTFVLSLAKGLKSKGVQVAVAAGKGDFLPNELEKYNIPFFYLNNLKRSKNPLAVFSFIIELRKLIRRENFDVVHFNSTNTLPGVFAAKLIKKKTLTVFTVHGLSILHPEYKASKILKIIFKAYFKFFLNYIQRIIFVSEYDSVEAAKQKLTNRGEVIYNGLEMPLDYFLSKDEARLELEKITSKNLKGKYLIGSIGRLAEQKHYDFLIKNWSEIKKIKPDSKLIIIGEGAERKKYEEMIKKYNVFEDIFLPGEKKDASRLLKGFDLFILPSIYEGLSISLIEALFSGIPVLASDVGGNREVIGIENYFMLNNDLDFLEKLKKVEKAKIDSSLFAAESMVKKYKEIYERN